MLERRWIFSVLKDVNPTNLEKAEELFLQGYNCAQAVVFVSARETSLAPELAVKLATGFGAGMGRQQEVCGAVTGGILALGLRSGRALGEEKAKNEETYGQVRSLMERFSAQHGSCLCRELLDGCDLRTEAGQREFKERGYLRSRCCEYVKSVVTLLDETAGPRPIT